MFEDPLVAAILAASDLSASHKLVWLLHYDRGRNHPFYSDLSDQDVGRKLGLSHRSVERARQGLIVRGYVARLTFGRNSCWVAKTPDQQLAGTANG